MMMHEWVSRGWAGELVWVVKGLPESCDTWTFATSSVALGKSFLTAPK